MIIINDSNWRTLLKPRHTIDGSPECLPRRSVYGSRVAQNMGLRPLDDYPQMLIDPKDYKDAILEAHRLKVMPMYRVLETWRKVNPRWNQNGLPWCWTWGCTGAFMTTRAGEKKKTVIFAPNSLGWLVNWEARGFFIDETAAGLRERGVASAAFVPDFLSRNPRTFKAGWEEDAFKNRFTSDLYDTDNSSVARMIQHCVTLLCSGISLYIAYDWWGHALECVGVNWNDNGVLDWVDSNSHNEDQLLLIQGTRGVPSEAIGCPSTELIAA